MREDKVVEVFGFNLASGHFESPQLATFKTTREKIRDLGGELLPATKQQVPTAELDGQGHYRRRNTGWGALS